MTTAMEPRWSEQSLMDRGDRMHEIFNAAVAKEVADVEAQIKALDDKIAKAHDELSKTTAWYHREDIENGIATLEDDAWWLTKTLRSLSFLHNWEDFLENRLEDKSAEYDRLKEDLKVAERLLEGAGPDAPERAAHAKLVQAVEDCYAEIDVLEVLLQPSTDVSDYEEDYEDNYYLVKDVCRDI